MVVDSISHVTPDGRWLDMTLDASQRRLLTEMDQAGVERAIIVAPADENLVRLRPFPPLGFESHR